MFGFSKKNKSGGIDYTKHNATPSVDNIINGMTPPPQSDVQVNQVMPSAPSPAPAAPPCHFGPPSSVPTDALDASIPDPPTRDLHNSPESNVRSPSERLELDDVALKFNGVPLIDLSCPDKDLVNRQIAEACRDGGCFQVINYGVSMESMEKTKSEAKEICQNFCLGKHYRKVINYGVSMESMEKTKSEAKEICQNFCLGNHYQEEYPKMELRELFKPLVFTVLGVLYEILSFTVDEFSTRKVQGDDQGQHVAMNYYPPSTVRPGLTRGALQAGHTDPNAFTIHLLDQAGMQIFRQGRWIDVETHPGALLVTIGDKIEEVSKGKYKSARYRMTVNPNKERISLGSFGCREENATSTPGPSTGKFPVSCI